jgi:hypothetical protein
MGCISPSHLDRWPSTGAAWRCPMVGVGCEQIPRLVRKSRPAIDEGCLGAEACRGSAVTLEDDHFKRTIRRRVSGRYGVPAHVAGVECEARYREDSQSDSACLHFSSRSVEHVDQLRGPRRLPSRTSSAASTCSTASLHELPELLWRKPGILSDAAHREGVDWVVARNGQNPPAIRHDDVFAFTNHLEARLLQSSHGLEVRDSRDLRHYTVTSTSRTSAPWICSATTARYS